MFTIYVSLPERNCLSDLLQLPPNLKLRNVIDFLTASWLITSASPTASLVSCTRPIKSNGYNVGPPR